MKVLIIGSSGSGKTYLSKEFRRKGVNAFDADDIDELHGWYNSKGDKVKFPYNAGAEFMDNHEFLWEREVLEKLLSQNSNIYLFGMSGNVAEMKDLFDKVYYLKVPEKILLKRLDHPTRENPMGRTAYQKEQVLNWLKVIEKKAQEMNAESIDGTLLVEEIFNLILKK